MATKGKKLVTDDYSQVELRVVGELSQDKVWFKTFINGGDYLGADPHQSTADGVGCSRKFAKIVNFGTIYGMSNVALSEALGISKSKAQDYLDGFWLKYPGTSAMRNYIFKALEQCKYVKTISGRRRRWVFINDASKREGFNTIIQGSSGDLMKVAMCKLFFAMDRTKANLILQVHDEITADVDEDYAEELAKIMEWAMVSAINFRIPILAEPSIGDTWYDTK